MPDVPQCLTPATIPSPETPATDEGITLDLFMPKQTKSRWCWAAVGSSLDHFYYDEIGNGSAGISQHDLAREIAGLADQTEDLVDVLCHIRRAGSSRLGQCVDYQDLRSRIHSREPVCCELAIGSLEGAKHYVAVVGWWISSLGIQMVDLRDSHLSDGSRVSVPYQTLRSGYRENGDRCKAHFYTQSQSLNGLCSR